MKVLDAKKITGSLTRTSKMPGLSYSLPAWECKTGSKLRNIKGSVCASCYALKGNYTRYKAIKAAQYVRLEALKDTKWIAAMVAQIIRQKYFRWHDAGDIQSMEHLYKIFRVCELTPETKHWMPTREAQFLSKIENPTVEVPSNLIIRMSSHMVDQGPVKFWPWTSTVTSGQGSTCPAPKQGGQCKDCRSCWDRSVSNVCYGKH
jgi:hypothetical protein